MLRSSDPYQYPYLDADNSMRNDPPMPVVGPLDWYHFDSRQSSHNTGRQSSSRRSRSDRWTYPPSLTYATGQATHFSQYERSRALAPHVQAPLHTTTYSQAYARTSPPASAGSRTSYARSHRMSSESGDSVASASTLVVSQNPGICEADSCIQYTYFGQKYCDLHRNWFINVASGRPHTCTICFIGFVTSDEMYEHQSQEHYVRESQRRRLPCIAGTLLQQPAPTRPASIDTLDTSPPLQRSASSTMYRCRSCALVFSNHYQLLAHEMSGDHSDEQWLVPHA